MEEITMKDGSKRSFPVEDYGEYCLYLCADIVVARDLVHTLREQCRATKIGYDQVNGYFVKTI